MNQFLNLCRSLSRLLDALANTTGRSLAWLALIMAVVVTIIVFLRKLAGFGSVGAQESVVYMHAFLIMLTSAYTLCQDAHVRVDIFYRRYTTLQKAWVNCIGSTVLLLPLALSIVAVSWEFVIDSWVNREASADAGGIPAVYLLKTVLLVNGLLLALQAISEIAKTLPTIITTSNPSIIDD